MFLKVFLSVFFYKSLQNMIFCEIFSMKNIFNKITWLPFLLSLNID